MTFKKFLVVISTMLLFAPIALTGCKQKPKLKPGECRTDKDCKSGEYCLNGQCRQCREDKHCPAGQKCMDGVCGNCRTNADCKDGQICRENMCGPCRADSDCPNGFCKDGKCVPGCKSDDDCKDEEVCKNGKCEPAPKPEKRASLCQLGTVYFDFNRANLRSDALKKLDENFRCLQSVKDKKVHLNGHCDPRGTEEYNLALSNRRAQAVKRYLQRLGISADRLHVVPKGELEASGTDESGWAQDRKVEFVWY